MEERTNLDRTVVIIITLAGMGLTIESVLGGWEFWLPLVMVTGAVAAWFLHITQFSGYKLREACYLAYAMVIAFFHGVHDDSFFDVALVFSLLLVAFSVLDRIILLNFLMVEYALVLVIQLVLAMVNQSVEFDLVSTSRFILHIICVICIYYVVRKITLKNMEVDTIFGEMNDKIELYSREADDFLTNISHELRTPVNVVNGMSSLILQKHSSEKISAIKDAGIRLSHQIDDILDHTEIERGELHVDEEKYMVSSLVNDVIADFRIIETVDAPELVVDLDPMVPAFLIGDYEKLHKILRHLLDNAIKFTDRGGVYVRIESQPQKYGVNLIILVSDTGCGMTPKEKSNASSGLYQANKSRNRNSGGIGIGLNVVYGFVHSMGGFVKIDSEKGRGTTVRICIPQMISDPAPCLSIDHSASGNVIFHVNGEKYAVPEVREFYRNMAVNIARGLNIPLFSATTTKEVERLLEKMEVTHIFMGAEEYEADPKFFDELANRDIIVAVSAHAGFKATSGSGVIIMPKPLYGLPVTKILNRGGVPGDDKVAYRRPVFKGVKALIVDDEPMNLVVATGLFRDYGMDTDIADSGIEAIEKYVSGDYELIFMDHMMPVMDGVEAMKRIREKSKEMGRDVIMVALTANVVSGAREMFLSEGFDGFIAKPIDIGDFERVMKRVLPESKISYEGRAL